LRNHFLSGRRGDDVFGPFLAQNSVLAYIQTCIGFLLKVAVKIDD